MAWVSIALLGCGLEFSFDPVEEGDPPPLSAVVTETFVQHALPQVDLLVVVDDTASMEQEQERLADAFGGVATLLEDAGVRWQVGVTTTSMSGDEAGFLRGNPYVLTESESDGLSERLLVGVDGEGDEAGLAAAATALQLAGEGGPNEGFRRSDAALHVLFVSDADDHSDALLGEDPAGVFLDVLASEAARTGRPAVASALVGDLPDGCTSDSGTAEPAKRYHEVVLASAGSVGSLCSGDFSTLLEGVASASITYETRFPLRATPRAGTLSVTVNGLATEDWSLLEDPPTLEFDTAPAPESVIEVRYSYQVAS